MLDVVLHGVDLMQGHAPLDPPVDGAGLVLGKIVAGLGAQEHEDLLERILALRHLLAGEPRHLAEHMGRKGNQLGRHLGRRQLKVHETGGDGAAGHAVILGGFRALHHDHAALALDGPHPQGAVTAGAGEDHADGPVVLILGQRAEEKVNGQAAAARGGGLQQLEGAAEKGHVAIGGDDVGAVGAHHHAVLDLEHLHAGVALDQVGEDALVVRSQVLHQDKGHARVDIGRHAREKRLERGQSAGRGADADNRKPGRIPLGRCRCGCGRRGGGVCLVAPGPARCVGCEGRVVFFSCHGGLPGPVQMFFEQQPSRQEGSPIPPLPECNLTPGARQGLTLTLEKSSHCPFQTRRSLPCPATAAPWAGCGQRSLPSPGNPPC